MELSMESQPQNPEFRNNPETDDNTLSLTLFILDQWSFTYSLMQKKKNRGVEICSTCQT